MARITVEDCLDKVDNRFQLVLVATRRARQLEQGKQSTLELENDKPTVLALREIAAGLVGAEILREAEVQPEEMEEIEISAEAEVEAEAGAEPSQDEVSAEPSAEEGGAEPE